MIELFQEGFTIETHSGQNLYDLKAVIYDEVYKVISELPKKALEVTLSIIDEESNIYCETKDVSSSVTRTSWRLIEDAFDINSEREIYGNSLTVSLHTDINESNFS